MSVMYFVSESVEALAAITEVSFSQMPKFEQTTFLTLSQNHDTNTCNFAKCF